MTGKIIDGRAVAEKLRLKLKEEIAKLDKNPGLAIIQLGSNPASNIYIKHKLDAAEQVGIKTWHYKLDEDTSEAELLSLIDKLNNNTDVSGMIVQLPLPEHINVGKVLEAISPDKDADGFHPLNQGRLWSGVELLVPATPKGIIKLIESTGSIEGKKAVIVGRSTIVGKPVAALLLNRNATVTICHSRTKDLKSETLKADILVVAAGKPGLIRAEMVKPGAVVIDVGTTKTPDGLKGDVDFEKVKEVAGFITPVPGGVGPMTVTMLLDNTLRAYYLQRKRGETG